MDYEKLTVKELQEKLVELGMPEDDVEAFRTKAPLIASIKQLEKADKEEPKEEKETEKVKTIEETPDPVEDRRIDQHWVTKAQKMQDHLLAQEQVSILVPLEPKEKVGVVEWHEGEDGRPYQVHISGDIITPTLNGYKYMIPKGRYTKVPRQVAELVSDAQQQLLDAGKDIKVDRVDPRTGRPVAEAL